MFRIVKLYCRLHIVLVLDLDFNEESYINYVSNTLKEGT
jgi:hypothetical protein